MSATFKNAKKKLSQSELRKFMNEHKEKSHKTNVKKIESPLAKFKYNEAGQLTCILCKSIVRSEAVWTVHINAKLHRQNVEQAKKLKQQTNNFTTALKRPLTPPNEVPTKKVKGILKNATQTITNSNITIISNETQSIKDEPQGEIPKDFFDKETAEEMEVENPSETLPEGFFDDPRLDAKARNIEFKDPIEEEWEKFQREIKDANHESAAIIAEDQEEATNERQIDEIEEQMKNWSRVVNLERKKVEIIAVINDENGKMDEGLSSSGDEEDFDEYLDWRAKKAYK